MCRLENRLIGIVLGLCLLSIARAMTQEEAAELLRQAAGSDRAVATAALKKLTADEKASVRLVIQLVDKDWSYIEKLLRQMGAAKYRDRERAMHELIQVGGPFRVQLQESMAKTRDPEIKMRLKRVLAKAKATDNPTGILPAAACFFSYLDEPGNEARDVVIRYLKGLKDAHPHPLVIKNLTRWKVADERLGDALLGEFTRTDDSSAALALGRLIIFHQPTAAPTIIFACIKKQTLAQDHVLAQLAAGGQLTAALKQSIPTAAQEVDSWCEAVQRDPQYPASYREIAPRLILSSTTEGVRLGLELATPLNQPEAKAISTGVSRGNGSLYEELRTLLKTNANAKPYRAPILTGIIGIGGEAQEDILDSLFWANLAEMLAPVADPRLLNWARDMRRNLPKDKRNWFLENMARFRIPGYPAVDDIEREKGIGLRLAVMLWKRDKEARQRLRDILKLNLELKDDNLSALDKGDIKVISEIGEPAVSRFADAIWQHIVQDDECTYTDPRSPGLGWLAQLIAFARTGEQGKAYVATKLANGTPRDRVHAANILMFSGAKDKLLTQELRRLCSEDDDQIRRTASLCLLFLERELPTALNTLLTLSANWKVLTCQLGIIRTALKPSMTDLSPVLRRGLSGEGPERMQYFAACLILEIIPNDAEAIKTLRNLFRESTNETIRADAVIELFGKDVLTLREKQDTINLLTHMQEPENLLDNLTDNEPEWALASVADWWPLILKRKNLEYSCNVWQNTKLQKALAPRIKEVLLSNDHKEKDIVACILDEFCPETDDGLSELLYKSCGYGERMTTVLWALANTQCQNPDVIRSVRQRLPAAKPDQKAYFLFALANMTGEQHDADELLRLAQREGDGSEWRMIRLLKRHPEFARKVMIDSLADPNAEPDARQEAIWGLEKTAGADKKVGALVMNALREQIETDFKDIYFAETLAWNIARFKVDIDEAIRLLSTPRIPLSARGGFRYGLSALRRKKAQRQ